VTRPDLWAYAVGEAVAELSPVAAEPHDATVEASAEPVGGSGAPVPDLHLVLPSPLEELHDDRVAQRGVRLLLKRDDLIHPELPGNKWRKLKYNLADASAGGHRTLLTFGGAYSHHIRAVAAAGQYFGFSTIGVIRGEEHLPLNPMLAAASRLLIRRVRLDVAAGAVSADPRARRRRTLHPDQRALPLDELAEADAV
jgi:hypothetical protein